MLQPKAPRRVRSIRRRPVLRPAVPPARRDGNGLIATAPIWLRLR